MKVLIHFLFAWLGFLVTVNPSRLGDGQPIRPINTGDIIVRPGIT